MVALPGTNTGSSWQQRLVHAGTVLEGKLVQLSWMKTIEFPVVAITVPILVVLVALLGNVLALPLAWTLAVATILGLAVVLPFMLREMLFFTQIEAEGTLSTAPTSPAEDVLNFFAAQDYEGLSGQMESLTSNELEFLSELIGKYLEAEDDLSQREWGFAKGVLDKIEEALDA